MAFNPSRKTRKHSQNASPKEPKGSETVPWTHRILQKICPQICRHFKSSNTLNKKGRRIQMDTRVREMFPDTKGLLKTGTDTQIPLPPSKLHLVHRRIKVCLRWCTNTTQRRSRPPHHIRKWTISRITIKEAYAIYMSIKKLSFYINTAKITVRSDHLPLKKFLEKNTMNSQVNNWAVELESQNITFEYIPGIKNTLADTLSRLIDIDQDIRLQPEEEGKEFGYF